MRKNWIAVASAEHARFGRDAIRGFMQVGHGKLAPLKRIKADDRVAYYSPTAVYGVRDDLQSFVSIGVVQPGEPFAFRLLGSDTNFAAAQRAVPSGRAEGSANLGSDPKNLYRRDVVYLLAQEAPIAPLLDDFELIENRQRWGYKFRFGLFDVSDNDMRLIAQAMQADLKMLAL